jgi:LuxR family transcriptional regulator, maltose regulon positive regulatory protein
MAEAPLSPRPAGDGEPHGLLATKLHVPSPRPGLVPRSRLVAQLDERLAAGLVLVSAPTGFGKTSLLAE